MPGGVSSPVRAFKSVGGNPIVFDKVGREGRREGGREGGWETVGNEKSRCILVL